MNDLTKEALRNDCGGLGMNIKRDPAELGHSPFQIPDGLMEEARRAQMRGYVNANAAPRYGDKSLNPGRPLTGKPEHYLTGYEGSRCDRLDVPRETIPLKHVVPAGSVDIDKFRKFCEEIGE